MSRSHRDTEFLDRVLAAQNSIWATALKEITSGAKTSHWIWWCWPAHAKVRDTSRPLYSLRHTRDAVGWLRHPTLGARFVELTTAACTHLGRGVKPTTLFGSTTDVEKFHECVTLFGVAAAADGRREEAALCARALSLLRVSPHPRASRIATEELAESIAATQRDERPPADGVDGRRTDGTTVNTDGGDVKSDEMAVQSHQALGRATEAAEADRAGKAAAALEGYVQAAEQLLASLAVSGPSTSAADKAAVRAKALECIERAESLKQSSAARSSLPPTATSDPADTPPLFPSVPISEGTRRLVQAQSEVLRGIVDSVHSAGVADYVKTGHWAWYVWPTSHAGAADHLQASVTSIADVRHLMRGPTVGAWAEALDVLAQALLARRRGRQLPGRPPPDLDVIFPSQDYERIDQFIDEWTAPEYRDATDEQPALRAAVDRFASAWTAVRHIREPPPRDARPAQADPR